MKLTCNSPKGAVRLFSVAVAALTLLCVVLRCLSLSFFFDQKLGYYEKDAILPTVHTVLLVVSFVAL
ncbi:MAG: hypothetical protein IKA76_07715, partial [Clostridia bacterium]|nr:hypothetical protein [Clostridia bacterium]